jgi:hypothetical protein
VLLCGMMAVFTLAVAAAVYRGLDFECGCFGTADASSIGLAKLGQNLALLVVAAIGTARSR